MARYPSFLKKEPLIWGISLSDLIKLSLVMFVLSLFNVPESFVLVSVGSWYLGLIVMRKTFPKRHFEFLMKKKNHLPLYLSITNSTDKVK